MNSSPFLCFLSETKLRVSALFLALLCLCSSTVYAGSKTGTQTESATVSNSCVINSTDNLLFGNYLPSSGAALQTSGTIKLKCTKGAAVTVLPTSGGSSLTGAGGHLSYTLYVDSGMSKVWGGPSFGYVTYDFSSRAGLNMYAEQGLSFATCKALANSTAFWFQGSTTSGTGLCGVNLGNASVATCMPGATQCWVTTQYGSNSTTFLMAANGTLTNLHTGPYGLTTAYYLPSASSTQVSGLTYTVPATVSGTNNQSLTGSSTSAQQAMSLTYYGQVPALQDIAPGTYTDMVTVQVSF